MPRPSPIEPEAILRELLELDPGLRIEPYWGERSIFYNPERARPLGVIVASVKDHDGPNDASAELSRAGVYRFAFGMAPGSYAERFGAAPERPVPADPGPPAYCSSPFSTYADTSRPRSTYICRVTLSSSRSRSISRSYSWSMASGTCTVSA